MTKKDYHKLINKRFYEFINEKFPQYEINNEEGYGTIYLIHKERDNYSILYHQSQHYVCCHSWMADDVKSLTAFLQNYLDRVIIPESAAIYYRSTMDTPHEKRTA